MRKFVINVNGKSYEVEVEETGGGVSTAPRISAPAAPIAAVPIAQPLAPAAPVAKPSPAAPTSAPVGSTIVKAPMPGTILDIKVNIGDTVKSGDVLCVLEAMKMENEIMAAGDGTVVAINTSKGASVNNGDPLISLA